MYYYLHGLITLHNKNNVVIECQGVGYDFMCTNVSDFPIGEIMFVYIYHHITEDGNYFIGFKSLDEKEIFSSLISVKGIGIKTAINIMSKTNVNDIKSAIKEANNKFFEKIPGVGSKSAFQIILDLKGKLNSFSSIEKEDKTKNLAYLGLKELGFNDGIISSAFENIESK